MNPRMNKPKNAVATANGFFKCAVKGTLYETWRRASQYSLGGYARIHTKIVPKCLSVKLLYRKMIAGRPMVSK